MKAKTVNLLALVHSLFGLIAVTTGAITMHDEVFTKPQKSQNDGVQFTSVKLVSQGIERGYSIDWKSPDLTEVSVQLHNYDNSIDANETREWKGKPSDTDSIQRMLTRIGSHKTDIGTQYTLHLYENEKPISKLSWNIDHETQELSILRNALETNAHIEFVEVMIFLNISRAYSETGAYEKATKIVKQGIDKLGDNYHDEGSIDDSGMKLVLAEAEIKKGMSKRAFSLLTGVLSSRISQYMRVYLPLNEL